MNILGIPSVDIEDAWPVAVPFLQPAMLRTPFGKLYDLPSVKAAVKEKSMQLWFIEEDLKVRGVAVTQIISYPKAKVLDILLLGGYDYKDWGRLGAELSKQYAAENGCQFVRGYGRLGWARMLKHLNIQPSIYFDFPVGEVPHAN